MSTIRADTAESVRVTTIIPGGLGSATVAGIATLLMIPTSIVTIIMRLLSMVRTSRRGRSTWPVVVPSCSITVVATAVAFSSVAPISFAISLLCSREL